MKLYFSRLVQRLPKYISAMGFFPGLSYSLIKIREKLGIAPVELYVRANCLTHPLRIRARHSSDTLVFEQVCVDREFDFVSRLSPPVKFILDLGANIGCASAYFLSAFPDASVIAVEPDPQNAARCQENLCPYGDRATVIHGAVWHTSGKLVLARGSEKEWGIQVRQAEAGEDADVAAYSISDLMEISPCRQIDLLKIDIEGSESALFSTKTEIWLGKVRNISVELHGRECERVFNSALEGFRLDRDRLGEHVLCLNLSPIEQQDFIG